MARKGFNESGGKSRDYKGKGGYRAPTGGKKSLKEDRPEPSVLEFDPETMHKFEGDLRMADESQWDLSLTNPYDGKDCHDINTPKGKAAIADMLLNDEGSKGIEHGVIVGYYYDKDGKALVSSGPDGKGYVPVMHAITAPSCKSKLEDVQPEYLSAISDDPRFKKAMDELNKLIQSMREDPWSYEAGGEPPSVEHSIQPAESNKNFLDYYHDTYAALAGLHLQGGYDKTLDSMGPMLDARREVRNGLARENPEMDKAMANKARHWINVEDKLLERGASFGDCTFMGPDGKPIDKLPPDHTPMDYDRYTQAIVYGLDHGYITGVKGPDGKSFEMPLVQDEYTKNLDYYDKNAKAIEEYTHNLYSKTAEQCSRASEAHKDDKGHPEIGGCRITGVTNSQYYADAAEKAVSYESDSADKLKSYESGKNPMMETLTKYGMSNPSVQAQADKQAQNAATIQSALNYSANIREAESSYDKQYE